MTFICGKTYIAKVNQKGKFCGLRVAKAGQRFKCVRDGRDLRLEYQTVAGTKVSWHVCQYDRSNFIVK